VPSAPLPIATTWPTSPAERMRRTAGVVRRGTYRDSVQLMRIARRLRDRPGIDQAEILMGTESNLESLRRSNLLPSEVEQARPGPNDLVMVVAGADDAVGPALQAAAETVDRGPFAEQVKRPRPEGPRSSARSIVRSHHAALVDLPDANLALISVPGPYVFPEAMWALRAGLNLMIFSSNITVAEEIALKEEATRHGLLVMGPDCGTALLGGAALGFANAVQRGPIGLVGAAGTGLQEVMVLIDRAGSGVSQAIGTGGRDVSEQIAGRSMLAGLGLLDKDSSTRTIVVVGKPPHAATLDRILEQIGVLQKPAVVCFLGAPPEPIARAGALPVATLEDGAVQAVALADNRLIGDVRASLYADHPISDRTIEQNAFPLNSAQRYIRGLYCGGTLANEAALILLRTVGAVSGNLTLPGIDPSPDPGRSRGHTIVDLGDEIFTRGRPHPMIEPAMREQRVLQEAHDPSTGVILMDFVLGYGAHPDPVGALLPTLKHARDIATAQGRGLVMVASVCGTDRDPQNRNRQIEKLTSARVMVAPTNAAAARLAARFVGGPEYTGTAPIGSREHLPEPTARGSGDVGSLLSGAKVINVGILDFAEALWTQQVPCVHVDWSPQSRDELELENVLNRLL
jgi:FdrA protein